MMNNQETSVSRSSAIRKRRVPLSMESLKKIISLRDKGKSVSEMAEIVDMSPVAIYKILNRLTNSEENGVNPIGIIKKSGPKISDHSTDIQSVSQIVQFDNSLTQRQIKARLSAQDVHVSQPTVSRLLKKAELTRKRLKLRPAFTQTPEHLQTRMVFAREIRMLNDDILIYLDETGFNLHTGSNFGYSPKNTDAYRLVSRNRERNVSLLACISNTGILHHKMIVGSFTGEGIANFLCEAKVAIMRHSRNAVVIMDNASIHHSILVREFSINNGIRVKYLPAYCPQLNPIEEFFGTLKSRYSEFRENINNSDEIIETVGIILGRMGQELDFENYYRSMRRYLEMAFQRIWF